MILSNFRISKHPNTLTALQVGSGIDAFPCLGRIEAIDATDGEAIVACSALVLKLQLSLLGFSTRAGMAGEQAANAIADSGRLLADAFSWVQQGCRNEAVLARKPARIPRVAH